MQTIQFVPNVWDGKEAGKNHPKKVWPLFYYLIALVCQGLFLLSGLIMSFFFPLRLDSVTSVWALKFLNVRDKHVALESSSWGWEAALEFCVTFSTAITLNFLKPLSHLKRGLLLLSLTELSRWPMLTTTHLQTSKRYHVREKRNVLVRDIGEKVKEVFKISRSIERLLVRVYQSHKPCLLTRCWLYQVKRKHEAYTYFPTYLHLDHLGFSL